MLKEIVEKYDLPSIGYAVVANNEIQEVDVYWIRRQWSEEKVTVNDQYHIGSCSKSFTATLTAIMVQDWLLQWNTQIGEVFTDITMHEKYKNVTVEQLLAHIWWCPGNLMSDMDYWKQLCTFKDAVEWRKFLLHSILEQEPQSIVWKEYVYSNAGYAIVSSLLETLSKQTFEDLMIQRLCLPLWIDDLWFWPAGTEELLDQPCGHAESGEAKYGDNPAALNAAGRIHCSINSFAKFLQSHCLGSITGHPLLQKKYFDYLYSTKPGGYGLGFRILERDWSQGPILYHRWSNTRNMAIFRCAPHDGYACAVLTNQWGEKAGEACEEVAVLMREKFLL